MSGDLPPHETVEETATYYIQEMRTVQRCGPYLLCGLSFGGLVAYEMARQLEAAGEAVALLILFDTWGTGYTQALNFSDGAWPMRLYRSVRYKIGFHRENLSACQDTGARIAYLWERFGSVKRQLGQDRRVQKGNSGHVNPAEMALPEIYKAEKLAEIRAIQAYHPGAYGGMVHLFRARLQRGASSEASLGWSRLVQDLKIVEVLGTHYSLLDEPCVQVNVQHLHHLLAEFRAL
jgi:thioesterase domain-containing protein